MDRHTFAITSDFLLSAGIALVVGMLSALALYALVVSEQAGMFS